MEIEGKYTHPLLKFLKRHSQIFDFDYLVSPPLRSDFHMFLTNEEGNRSYYFKATEGAEKVLAESDTCFERLEKKIETIMNNL